MSLPKQKSLTSEQLRQFCEYNFSCYDLQIDLPYDLWMEWPAEEIANNLHEAIVEHLDPTVILDWIRDNLGPEDIWDMDEYDSALIREYVSIGNERAYDWHNDR